MENLYIYIYSYIEIWTHITYEERERDFAKHWKDPRDRMNVREDELLWDFRNKQTHVLSYSRILYF
jgi:hypothetical protein